MAWNPLLQTTIASFTLASALRMDAQLPITASRMNPPCTFVKALKTTFEVESSDYYTLVEDKEGICQTSSTSFWQASGLRTGVSLWATTSRRNLPSASSSISVLVPELLLMDWDFRSVYIRCLCSPFVICEAVTPK